MELHRRHDNEQQYGAEDYLDLDKLYHTAFLGNGSHYHHVVRRGPRVNGPKVIFEQKKVLTKVSSANETVREKPFVRPSRNTNFSTHLRSTDMLN